MINGVTVDNTIVGSPAFNCKQITRGDVILRVDGIDATADNIIDLLVGSDIAGSSVEISLARGGAQVSMQRLHSKFRLI